MQQRRIKFHNTGFKKYSQYKNYKGEEVTSMDERDWRAKEIKIWRYIIHSAHVKVLKRHP